MSSSKNLYSIHRIFMVLMFASLALGALFFVTNNLDFIINAITFGRASFPNIVYWLTKTFGATIIPLVFLVPSTPTFERIKVAKYSFIIYGLLHIMAISWAVLYISQHGFDGLFSNDTIIQFQRANVLEFSHVFWGTYSWSGTILSVVFGLLCIYTGFNFDDKKQKVCILLVLLAAIRLIAPIFVIVYMKSGFNEYAFWITNNYADFLSFAVFTAAVILASVMDSSWISLIWDHEIPQREEDDD